MLRGARRRSFMIDITKLFIILVTSGSLISAFAAITAGFMMANVTKKFGTGILASGFKTNSVGVFFIAIAIVIDSVDSYLQVTNYYVYLPTIVLIILLLVKEVFFVFGTYVIVIGSKKTGDKIESLTK